MKIEVTDVEVGPMRLERQKRRVVGNLVEEFTVEISPVPANGRYFECFRSPDGDVSPEDAFDGVIAGSIEIVTPFEEANALVADLVGRARLTQVEARRYTAVIDALSWCTAETMRAEALKVIGHDPDDDFVNTADHSFLTTQEVARLFRVDDSTVRAWAGQRLPQSLRIGRKHLFRSDAIMRIVVNAGPARKPERPTTPSPADTRPKTRA